MQSVKSYFDNKVKRHGYGLQAIEWGSFESQQKRFKVLCSVGNLNEANVLDVGCGFGDLLDFLKPYGIKSYTGLDISPQMIAIAKQRHRHALFIVGDIRTISYRLTEKYDVVLASGVLYKMPSWDDVAGAIQRMFSLCTVALAFNCLSIYHSEIFGHIQTNGTICRWKDENYFDPSRVLDFCMQLGRNVTLRHDYMRHDFTIYLRKATLK